MAVSLADLTNQVERELLVHYARPLYDVPASSYNTSVTSIVLANTDQISPGAILDAGFELMMVVNWVAGTRTATVIRGFLGTTAASGTTSTLVRINPPVTSAGMVDAFLDELRSWDERVYATDSDSVSFGASATSVEITPARRPYRVLYARPRPLGTNYRRLYLDATIRSDEPAGQFASTYSLHIENAIGATTVDLLYAVPFDISALTTSSDLLATHGLSEGMLEILKWGALARVTSGKEARRLDPSTYNRPDQIQGFPATALLQASAEYRKARDMAYDREARRLLAKYPPRFS